MSCPHGVSSNIVFEVCVRFVICMVSWISNIFTAIQGIVMNYVLIAFASGIDLVGLLKLTFGNSVDFKNKIS